MIVMIELYPITYTIGVGVYVVNWWLGGGSIFGEGGALVSEGEKEIDV
jgi:hypothetical protein